MMSGLGDPSGTRLVAFSEEERDWLSQAIDLLREEGRANTAARVENIVAKYDAADVPEIIEGPDMYAIRTGRRVAIIDLEDEDAR